MTHYLIAKIEIDDREEYAKYEAGFIDIFMKYKGKMLAVDEDPEVLEGEWPATRTVLVEFPDSKAAHDWYDSEEYQTLAQHRFKASDGNIIMIKGFE